MLEWKIKYGKYKPLTVPGKCVDCLQKTVKHSYHIRFGQEMDLVDLIVNIALFRCGACVEKTGKCAKCNVKVSS